LQKAGLAPAFCLRSVGFADQHFVLAIYAPCGVPVTAFFGVLR
jgi:hypothetical protein